ncbi:hypothetical protein X963_2785 [Burkholderia pseudomallei MSHR7498]|nr:hypothetical protein DO73_5577 [Burkholderia pseudomallei]KGS84804.1 hypothetical protein X976_5302 [Burkholderia pseudomallei MSHR7500]KGS95645.1 hypothetical protein X963_2785 [Burkholderia pseudomallei MSHR7498]KGC54457.1 hypothetical protein DO65_6053 [Burkholderia pseudomallei]KGC71127.1 hypothetical protein DP56_6057 [Burkholderia pseudomallei]
MPDAGHRPPGSRWRLSRGRMTGVSGAAIPRPATLSPPPFCVMISILI